jgi:hypothetical protein
MNQTNYINQKKIIHQQTYPSNKYACYNCSQLECNCSCHSHKNILNFQNRKSYQNENEKNIVMKKYKMK